MSASFENIAPPTTDYAEVVRRPLVAERCALLLVDIQEKLLPPIFQTEELVRNAKLLIRDGAAGRFPAGGNRGDRQASVLLFWQRSFLHAAQEATGQPQYLIVVRNGKSHLRDADRAGGAAGRIHCARRFGCCELAKRVELENRTGAHAQRGRGDFFDRDDDL
jgi:hypothetical protein